jgi:protein-S-isoprenylcysteine O-methyltransferase Ste14
MPRKHRIRVSKIAPIVLAAWVAWLLRRVERDYEEQERLSPQTSTAGWALYLAHAVLTVSAALRRQRPLPVGKTFSVAPGGASALLGSYLFAAGVREFRSFEQMSGVEQGELVKSGPYRYSRNPQVVGWGLTLLGAAIAGRSVRALLLVAAFFLVHRLHAPIEERHLERTFGEEYRSYRAEVPRFLGFPRAG